MLAMIEIWFSRESSRNHNHVILGQISTLQAYLIRFGRYCKHKRSALDLRLQAYGVPSETEIANIFGPYHKHYFKHMWSIPIKLGNRVKVFDP